MEVPKVPAKQVTSVVRLANARIPVDSSTIVDINPPIAFNYPIIIKVFDCSSIVEKHKFVRQNVIHKWKYFHFRFREKVLFQENTPFSFKQKTNIRYDIFEWLITWCLIKVFSNRKCFVYFLCSIYRVFIIYLLNYTP